MFRARPDEGQRCGQCGRAFIGTSAKGRSRLYHYYTCSTHYRYGTRNCGADRLPKAEFEEAVLEQMIEVYRDSDLISDALAELQTSEREERESVDVRIAALRQDQAGVRRSMDRYFAAFEHATMKPTTCQERLDNLQTRLDVLIVEEQALLTQEEADSLRHQSWSPSGRRRSTLPSTVARLNRERR